MARALVGGLHVRVVPVAALLVQRIFVIEVQGLGPGLPGERQCRDAAAHAPVGLLGLLAVGVEQRPVRAQREEKARHVRDHQHDRDREAEVLERGAEVHVLLLPIVSSLTSFGSHNGG